MLAITSGPWTHNALTSKPTRYMSESDNITLNRLDTCFIKGLGGPHLVQWLPRTLVVFEARRLQVRARMEMALSNWKLNSSLTLFAAHSICSILIAACAHTTQHTTSHWSYWQTIHSALPRRASLTNGYNPLTSAKPWLFISNHLCPKYLA